MGMEHIIMESLPPLSEYGTFRNWLINAPRAEAGFSFLTKVLQCGTNQFNTPFRFVKPFCDFFKRMQQNLITVHLLLPVPSPGVLSRCKHAHVVPEHLTFPAHLHLAAPAGPGYALTNGPVDEPAEIARIEFPGGTVLTRFQGTVPDFPAGPGFFCLVVLQRKQKQDLPFNMHGHFSPSLLEALNRLQRRAQEFG
jgi:hypothetical protein